MRYHSGHLLRRDKGFTLLELLVAVALGAVLITAFYSTFFSVIRAGEGTEAELERIVQAGRFLDRFTRDIHSSFFKAMNKNTLFTGGFKGSDSIVTFTGFTLPFIKDGVPTSDLVGVSYYLEEGEDGSALFREVFSPYMDERFKVEIVEKVREFEVNYFNGKDWSRAWDAALEKKLPEAVRVSVILDTGEEISTMARTMIR